MDDISNDKITEKKQIEPIIDSVIRRIFIIIDMIDIFFYFVRKIEGFIQICIFFSFGNRFV